MATYCGFLLGERKVSARMAWVGTVRCDAAEHFDLGVPVMGCDEIELFDQCGFLLIVCSYLSHFQQN